ncbi:uncharacterized protein LOC106666431 [Cimex lectularius]|uniref:1-acylglycerol-3-phosphate O-acyltransferase n=1 Tax=Cimex lectularius TaxID=79782 RepID=A0A8I6SN89_CIMLE|nr:uncharacterized protein LOC106666431 [Cimex lectularius]
MLSAIIFVYLTLIILPILLPQNHWARYYACYISFILLCSLFSFITIIVCILRLGNPQHIWLTNIAASTISKVLGLSFEVRGTENINKSKKGIIVLNHQSILDVLSAVTIFKYYGTCVGVARKEVFYCWPFGLAIYFSSFISINRDDRNTAFKSLSSGVKKHFEKYKNGTVFIFPEGTRNKNGTNLLPFKKGSFKLAIENQVPIYPVTISPYYFIKGKQFKNGKIIISLLEPISSDEMTLSDIDMLTSKTQNCMEEEYQRLFKYVTLNIKCSTKMYRHYGDCVGVARKEIKYLGLMGPSMVMGGYIFINRGNKESAIKEISKGIANHLRNYKDGKVIIFPEGTRNKIGSEFLPFKKGAFRAAIDNQVPIFPCVISPLNFIKKDKYFNKGKIIVTQLEPIPTVGMTAEDIDSLIEKTRNVMKMLIIWIVLFILFLLFPKYGRFSYLVRCFYSLAMCFISSMILFPYFILTKKNPRNLWLFGYSADIILWLMDLKLELRVVGKSKVDGHGIIVMNHQSFIDVVGVAKLYRCYGDCIGVARKEVKYLAPLGPSLAMGGYIFIDRENKQSAIKIISEGIADHFKTYKDGKVMIFPEGTRNKIGSNFLPFKKGAFRVAIDNQVPIFPCVISPYNFVKKNKYFNKGKIIITLMEPIPTVGMTAADADALLEKTRNLMLDEYRKLATELNPRSL